MRCSSGPGPWERYNHSLMSCIWAGAKSQGTWSPLPVTPNAPSDQHLDSMAIEIYLDLCDGSCYAQWWSVILLEYLDIHHYLSKAGYCTIDFITYFQKGKILLVNPMKNIIYLSDFKAKGRAVFFQGENILHEVVI